jgi:hypothetical protein
VGDRQRACDRRRHDGELMIAKPQHNHKLHTLPNAPPGSIAVPARA